jgi:hypothetical protein
VARHRSDARGGPRARTRRDGGAATLSPIEASEEGSRVVAHSRRFPPSPGDRARREGDR